MISESTVLLLQSAAAMFMAADYFFTEKQRVSINAEIQRALTVMRQKIDADVQLRVEIATDNSISFIVALLCMLLGWLVTKFLPVINQALDNSWVMGIVLLLIIGLFAGALPTFLSAIVVVLIPLFMATPTGFVLKFLILCPKGTVFGIGFLFLVASFVCRWFNLNG